MAHHLPFTDGQLGGDAGRMGAGILFQQRMNALCNAHRFSLDDLAMVLSLAANTVIKAAHSMQLIIDFIISAFFSALDILGSNPTHPPSEVPMGRRFALAFSLLGCSAPFPACPSAAAGERIVSIGPATR